MLDDHTQSPPTASNNVNRRLPAKFILKVREEYRIPQSTVDKVLQDVSALCYSAVDNFKDEVFQRIGGLENSDQFRSIMLESMKSISSPFQDLDMQHKQNKYFKEHFDYLVWNLVDDYKF